MTKDTFTEFGVIRDKDGVVLAVLTYRERPNGERLLSYSLMREFDDNGQMKRTCWFHRRHNKAIARLLPQIEDALAAEEAKHAAQGAAY